MNRNAASVTLRVSLPPNSIREFFEGWAKVEAAKNGSASNFDWSSIIPMFMPMFMPMIANMMKSCGPSVRVPQSCGPCPVIYDNADECAKSGECDGCPEDCGPKDACAGTDEPVNQSCKVSCASMGSGKPTVVISM